MYKYILSFAAYMALIVFYLSSQYSLKISIYEHNLEESVKRSLSSATNSFELLNDSYHNQNESKMAYIIKDASDASLDVRDKIRYELRKELTAVYNDRKLTHLDSLQIFDKKGRSIIRFHELDKYDDAIIDKRDSLKSMSKNLTAKSGFELGKYAVNYRFQYPLFYDGKFVGSYEFGVDFNALDVEMQKLFGLKNILYIFKENIQKIFLKEESKKIYKSIDIGKHSVCMIKTKIEFSSLGRFEKVINTDEMSRSIRKNKTCFIKYIYQSHNYITIITPIYDINSKYVGFLQTDIEDKVTGSIFRTYIEELIVAILLGIIVIYLVYRESKYKEYIRNIIDTQHDILIVTDGQNIYDANKKFLEFFGHKTLENFKQKSDCICDHFLNESGYLQKKMDTLGWFEYLIATQESKNIALMYNQEGEKRYFKVIVEGLSHSKNFILVFSDVTEELENKRELENKAYYDALTNIYSRERFDYYLNKRLHQKRVFSVIMFDIDHFKDVNDVYGHDIGDSVLKEITALVSLHIRKDDVFARWGGEEFMIIVNIDVIKAERFANKLREVIEQYQFQYVDDITCSFGVVKYRDDDQVESIIKRVDTMLYSAKESGRNCVVVVN